MRGCSCRDAFVERLFVGPPAENVGSCFPRVCGDGPLVNKIVNIGSGSPVCTGMFHPRHGRAA